MQALGIPTFDNDVDMPKTTKSLQKMERDKVAAALIPRIGHRDPGYPRHVILSMEHGQSFFIALPREEAALFRMRMLVAAPRCKCELTSKITTENGVEGARFWKISGPVKPAAGGT